MRNVANEEALHHFLVITSCTHAICHMKRCWCSCAGRCQCEPEYILPLNTKHSVNVLWIITSTYYSQHKAISNYAVQDSNYATQNCEVMSSCFAQDTNTCTKQVSTVICRQM